MGFGETEYAQILKSTLDMEDLITKHLRRYVVSDRGETEPPGDGVEAA